LSAAASFLATHEIPVNEAGTSKKVTGAQIQATLPNGTAGSSWSKTLTANLAAFSAATDLAGFTATITPSGAGRRIRVSYRFVYAVLSVATDQFQFTIQEGATVLQTALYVAPAGGFVQLPMYDFVILTPTNAAHTYKLTGVRFAGTGTATINASATQPAFFTVEDIGT
jgi:hypothetical protein